MAEPSILSCRRLLALGAVLVALGGQARAQEAEAEPRMIGPFELSGAVGAVADYIDRGISSSDNDPAIQGELILALPVTIGGALSATSASKAIARPASRTISTGASA